MSTKQSAGAKIAILIIVVVIIVVVYHLFIKVDQPTVVGNWKLQLRDVYSFDSNNNFKIKIGEEVYNYGEYTIDYSKEPISIDIVPKKQHIFANHYTPPLIKGIVRFQNPGLMEIALKADNSYSIFGGDRPTLFEGNDILLVSFARIKEGEE